MSNTFTKTSLRGFTLIELLVVIAIIGLLSTAIMGPVQTGLKKGRDTRKISDITQIQGALLQYAGDNNGKYPDYLAMSPAQIIATPLATYLASTTPTYMVPDAKMLGDQTVAGLKIPAARDRFMYVTYKDLAGFVVGYHLGVALENQNASLQGDADCGNLATGGGIGTGNPLVSTPAGLNVHCGTALGGPITHNNQVDAGAGNPRADDPSAAPNVDFGGGGTQEAAGAVCASALDTCIYDVTPN